MKLELRAINGFQWYDISKYVNGKPIIKETIDKSFNTIKVKLLLDDSFLELTDYIFKPENPIPSKSYLRFTQNGMEFHYRLGDVSQVKLRSGTTKLPSLYEHELNGIELLYSLSGRTLPSYSITQPKGIDYNRYQRNFFTSRSIDLKASLDGDEIVIPAGVVKDVSYINAGVSDIEAIYFNGKHNIKLYNISEEEYTIKVGFNLRATARTWGMIPGAFGTPFRASIFFEDWREPFVIARMRVRVIYYDINDSMLDEKIIERKIEYSGGEVELEKSGIDYFIHSFPELFSITEQVFFISSNANASYATVVIDVPDNNYERRNTFLPPSTGALGYAYPTTNIPGYRDDDYVKLNMNEISFNVISSLLRLEVENEKSTYYDLIEKALNDYNYLSREKVRLLPETSLLLKSYVAREDEFNSMTLYEILTKVFNLLGVAPFLTPDNYIGHYEKVKVARTLEVDETINLETQLENEYFYDKITSSVKNLVNEDNFVRERIALNATSSDTQVLIEDNKEAGFKTTHPIYYIGDEVLLYIPNFKFTLTALIGGVRHNYEVKGNTGRDYWWDIRERFLEQDIYNSLPDVRFDTEPAGGEPSDRALNAMGKGNTLSYKSGSKDIVGVFHKAPALPNFHFLTGAITTNEAEYAMIEMLICLGYEYVISNNAELINHPELLEGGFPNITLTTNLGGGKTILDAELVLKYCPIYEELTIKHLATEEHKTGLNFEKNVNINERLVSYEVAEEVLNKEMGQRGNIVYFATEEYASVADTLPINAVLENGYVISSKNMIVSKNSCETQYTLQKHKELFSDQVALPIKYERFLVPYEYVNREKHIENYLILLPVYDSRYLQDPRGCNKDFVEDIFLNGNIFKNDYIYGIMKLEYEGEPTRELLIKLGMLHAKRTLQLIGTFTDNYSAGNQLLTYAGTQEFDPITMSVPVRYTDIKGKVKEIKDFKIGYNSLSEETGLLRGGQEYPIREFPFGENVEMDTVYFEESSMFIAKDARERLLFNHTTFVSSQYKDAIEIYDLGEINAWGYQNLGGVNVVVENGNFANRQLLDTPSGWKLSLELNNMGNIFETNNALVLFEKKGIGNLERIKPLIVIRDPIFIGGNVVDIYISSTRYGLK